MVALKLNFDLVVNRVLHETLEHVVVPARLSQPPQAHREVLAHLVLELVQVSFVLYQFPLGHHPRFNVLRAVYGVQNAFGTLPRFKKPDIVVEYGLHRAPLIRLTSTRSSATNNCTDSRSCA